jgi:6,7-dimethyl-8-ribityllumazine synthase
VANEAARGSPTARETGIVIFEVLAVETMAQAEDRAGGRHGNKGWEAADAVLTMASLLDGLPEPREAG